MIGPSYPRSRSGTTPMGSERLSSVRGQIPGRSHVVSGGDGSEGDSQIWRVPVGVGQGRTPSGSGNDEVAWWSFSDLCGHSVASMVPSVYTWHLVGSVEDAMVEGDFEVKAFLGLSMLARPTPSGTVYLLEDFAIGSLVQLHIKATKRSARPLHGLCNTPEEDIILKNIFSPERATTSGNLRGSRE
uniref:Uncharacterized protein n=1 Tax=Oryza meridionalis TaxID=40149 RepID=A0A0E0EL40_9ORYZ